jgi:hypothetical protein
MGLDSYSMSRLTDKIQSYSMESGTLFDETYSGAAPTMFGTNTTPATWAESGSTAITTVNGPMPGQKAWQFVASTSSGVGKRLRNTGNDMNLVADNSYSFGTWIKFSNFYTTVSNTFMPMIAVRPVSRGLLISGFLNANDGLNTLFVTVGNLTFGTTNNITTDKWYYIAVRRDGANAFIYVNGELIGSTTSMTINTTATMTGYDFGTVQTNYNQTVQVGPSYIAPYLTIQEPQILEIWKYGSPTNRTGSQNADIRYWDGTTFTQSLNEKVYHSGGWQDVFASRWDGANWIAI